MLFKKHFEMVLISIFHLFLFIFNFFRNFVVYFSHFY